MTRICSLDLPLVAQRGLEEPEKRSILRTANGFGRRIALVWSFILGTPLLLFLVGRVTPPGNALFDAVATIIICLLMLAGLPAALMISRDCLRIRRRLLDDLRMDQICEFRGRWTSQSPSDPAYFKIEKNRALQGNDTDEVAVNVLPVSGRVVTIDGNEVTRWIEVQLIEIAPPASAAPPAGVTFKLEESENGFSVYTSQRDLSEAERLELKRHAYDSWRKPLPYTIGFAIWFSMPIAVIILNGRLATTVDELHAISLAIVTLGAVWNQITGTIRSRKLGADLAAGQLLIVKRVDDITPENGEEPIEIIDEWAELLTCSGLTWTENGVPADWRKVPAFRRN
jgi:hypothetical protein